MGGTPRCVLGRQLCCFGHPTLPRVRRAKRAAVAMLVRNRQRLVVAAPPPVARAVVVRECSCCRGRRRSGSVSVVELSVLVEDLMAHVTMPPTGIRWWRDDACSELPTGPISIFRERIRGAL